MNEQKPLSLRLFEKENGPLPDYVGEKLGIGYTMTEIAQEAGIGRQQLYYWLKVCGYQTELHLVPVS